MEFFPACFPQENGPDKSQKNHNANQAPKSMMDLQGALKGRDQPKGPSRTKNTRDSKFIFRSKFATTIVKHYGGHFETTIFQGK